MLIFYADIQYFTQALTVRESNPSASSTCAGVGMQLQGLLAIGMRVIENRLPYFGCAFSYYKGECAFYSALLRQAQHIALSTLVTEWSICAWGVILHYSFSKTNSDHFPSTSNLQRLTPLRIS